MDMFSYLNDNSAHSSKINRSQTPKLILARGNINLPKSPFS